MFCDFLPSDRVNLQSVLQLQVFMSAFLFISFNLCNSYKDFFCLESVFLCCVSHACIIFRVRIPSKCVFYYRCPEHGNRYVLSIVFAFDKEEDVYQFAFSYPYTYTRLQKYLDSLEIKQLPYLKREKIGETLVSTHAAVKH